MLKKKTLKALICAAVCLCCILGSVGMSNAASNSSLQSQISQLEKERDKLKSQVAELKADKSAVEKVKKNLDSQVANLQKQIDLCSTEIYKLDAEISANNAKIDEKNKALEDNKVLFKKRIRAIYMSGGNSEILLALDADNFADYLAKTALTRTVSARQRADAADRSGYGGYP